MKWIITISLVFVYSFALAQNAVIRINQLGYTPKGKKVAVWGSQEAQILKTFQLVNAETKKFAFSASVGKPLGAYGPFKQTYRLNFSNFVKTGRYYLQAGSTRSPEFVIGEEVYKGTADFCLRYMRQQRTGFNPFLKDSCHTRDGYTLYGEKAGLPDSTYVDVVGGWHDASDYLQYATTSANATYHLLMAYRDFPKVFGDEKLANGLDGKNGLADVADEAKWGLDWLLKMHPSVNIMFNQIADDRDHISMRIPALDSQYGRGHERPVYFVSGEPQQRGKFMNKTTGTSSTAAKFASAFALAHQLINADSAFKKADKRKSYYDKAFDAWHYALKKPGVTQTASVKAPYIYAEENWTDDMELAAAAIHNMVLSQPAGGDNAYYLVQALNYAKKEKLTPWLGTDTASHYQWYPFINLGHYELAKQLKNRRRGPTEGYTKEFQAGFWQNSDTITGYYRQGIEAVWNKAKTNAFYRGVPFIWCSNNLTTSFAIQCYWYRQLTGDRQFEELEQANFDWLFGLNPWGTSMVYGLPANGDTPIDPHSAFTHLKNYPIDGGLVDGPVYGSIYNNLIGIKLYNYDEYAQWQSDLAVYHDDYGDYSTNEPTMDGTASLIYLLAAKEAEAAGLPVSTATHGQASSRYITDRNGAIIRGSLAKKKIAIVFTGDEYGEGADFIANILKEKKAKASFFFTGRYYRNPAFSSSLKKLKAGGHYLGAHSDAHLLYADWTKRDSTLVTKQVFADDLQKNYAAMKKFGIEKKAAPFFLPPYEWYNDSIVKWTKQEGLQLITYTPGTLSHADYTLTDSKNFRSSEAIWQSIVNYEKEHADGLNGFILLMHVGAGSQRSDKFYKRLPQLIDWLKAKGYEPVTVNSLLTVTGQD